MELPDTSSLRSGKLMFHVERSCCPTWVDTNIAPIAGLVLDHGRAIYDHISHRWVFAV